MSNKQRDIDNKTSQNHNVNSRALSNPLSQPLSDPVEPNAPITPETLEIMEQSKLADIGEYLQHKIYKKVLHKVTEHIVKAMKRQKIIDSGDFFDEQGFMEDLYNSIKINVDKLDVWIGYNILKRPEVVDLKKAIVQREQRKQAKRAKIEQILSKIIQNHKQQKVQEIIYQFKQSRRKNYVKYVPNPEINTYRQKINRVLSRRPDPAEIEFQKAEQRNNAYINKSREETRLKFIDKFDMLKLQ